MHHSQLVIFTSLYFLSQVYKDFKKAKIIKLFQLAFASKIIHPEGTVLSYVVKHSAQLGKAKHEKNFF